MTKRTVEYWIQFLQNDPTSGDLKAAALLMHDLNDYGYTEEIQQVLNLITAVRVNQMTLAAERNTNNA